MVQQFEDRQCQIKDLELAASGKEFVQFYCLLVAVSGTNPYKFVVTDFTSNKALCRDVDSDLENLGFEPHALMVLTASDARMDTVLREYQKRLGAKLIERYGKDEKLIHKFCVVAVNGEIKQHNDKLAVKATRMRLLGDADRGVASLDHIYSQIAGMDASFVNENRAILENLLPLRYLASLPRKETTNADSADNQESSLQFHGEVKSEPLGDNDLIPDTIYQSDYVEEGSLSACDSEELRATKAAQRPLRAAKTPVTIDELLKITTYSDKLYSVSALVVAVLPKVLSHICVKTPASSDPIIRPIELLITCINDQRWQKPKYLNHTNSLRLHLDDQQVRRMIVDEPVERLYVNETLWQNTLGQLVGQKKHFIIHKKLVPVHNGTQVVWTCNSIV